MLQLCVPAFLCFVVRAYFKFTALIFSNLNFLQILTTYNCILTQAQHITYSMSMPSTAPRYYAEQANHFPLSKFTKLDSKSIDFMFHQIKNHIRQLLESISLVFKNYGIVHPVHHYFDTIFRLLSPVELNAVINFNYVKSMFQGRDAESSNESKLIENKFLNANKSMSKKTFETFGNSPIISENLQFVKDEIKKRNEGKDNFVVYPKEKNSFKPYSQKVARHTVRSRGLQDQILLWITSELQKGRKIKKLQIMKKGRELGKCFDFKACPRWCDNFLNRNPEIKKEIYKRLYVEGTYKKRDSSPQNDRQSFTKNNTEALQSNQDRSEQYQEGLSFDLGYYDSNDIEEHKGNEGQQKIQQVKTEQDQSIYDDDQS